MARPRIHDEDALLDAAEALLTEGVSALTIRALATRTGAPSGTLYHAFGSRTELVGRLWLRGARAFLDRQHAAIDAVLGDGPDGRRRDAPAGGTIDRERAGDAVVAASLTLLDLADERPATAALLMAHRRDDLLGEDLSPGLAAQLGVLDEELLDHMKRLARALTGRADRRTVDVVATCLVDLPTAFRPGRRDRVADPRVLLAAAVRGVLDAAS